MSVRVSSAVALLMVTATSAHAECTSEQSKPKWATKKPTGYRFDYAVGEAQAATKTEALQSAIKNGIMDLINTGRIQVSGATEILENAEIVRSGEGYDEEVRVNIKDDVKIKTGATQLDGLEIVETYEEDCAPDGYHTRALVRVKSKTPREGGPPVYAATAWVPSLAQFQKEESGKGIFILSTMVPLLAGGVVTLAISQDAQSQAAAATNSQVTRDFYNDRASLMQTVALASFITAGAVYVYNVLDGILSPDTLHYAEAETTRPFWLAAVPAERGGLAALGGRF